MGKTRQSANLVSDGNITIDISNDRIGIGITVPSVKLDVDGEVKASSFTGSGSGLTNITASGLSGTPNISVGDITAASATFSGNVSVAGTITYEDVTNVDSVGLITARSGIQVTSGNIIVDSGEITTNTLNVLGITTSNETRFLSVAEKLVRVDGNTVSIAYTTTGANVGYCTNPSGNITLAVSGIPTDSSFDNHIISFSIVVNQTGTARSCTEVTLNGVSETIKWAGGSLSAAISGVTTTNGYDIYSFTGINTIGSASTAANYELLGVVNGGFR